MTSQEGDPGGRQDLADYQDTTLIALSEMSLRSSTRQILANFERRSTFEIAVSALKIAVSSHWLAEVPGKNEKETNLVWLSE
ncbi:hypothetical protein Aduo_017859 [Ancylostoma duodenale]